MRTAIHEAGHAVLEEHHFPGSVRWVTIEPSEGAEGGCYVERDGDYQPEYLDGMAVAGLAGAVAESLLMSRNISIDEPFSPDLHEVISYATSRTGNTEQTSDLMGDWLREAARLVRHYELEIRALADALIQGRIISGDAVRYLMETH